MPGFHFVGVAHLDPWGDTRHPGYRGSLLTPVEKMQLADRVSGSANKTPLTTDHGSFAGYGYDPVALGEAVGYSGMVFVDVYGKVHTVGTIPGEFRVAREIVDDIKAGGRWGLSFVTDMMLRGRPEDKIVDSLDITSLGVTKNPAWGNEGTWIHEWSEDEVAFRQMLRDRYLSQPGMYVPEKAREQLAQFEAQDRLILAERARQRTAASSLGRHLHRAATFAMSDTAVASLPPPPAVSEPAPPVAAAPPAVVPVAADESERIRKKLFDNQAEIKRVQNPMKRVELVDMLNQEAQSVSRHMSARQIAQLGPIFDFIDSEREAFTAAPQAHMRSLVQENALSKEAADFVFGMMQGPILDPNQRHICEAVAASSTAAMSAKTWEESRRKEVIEIGTENATLKRKYEEANGELESLKKRMVELEQRASNPLNTALATEAAASAASVSALAAAGNTPAAVAASSGDRSFGDTAARDFARMLSGVKPSSISASRAFEMPSFSRTTDEKNRGYVNHETVTYHYKQQ